MGMVQQAVLDFDEEIQAPWRPRLVAVVDGGALDGGSWAAPAPLRPQLLARRYLPPESRALPRRVCGSGTSLRPPAGSSLLPSCESRHRAVRVVGVPLTRPWGSA